MIDFGQNCSWCGHEPHAEACQWKIQTGSGKKPETKDCPCIKRSQQ